ncbi:MAG: AarF/ABC1/UbiB kinase family protein [Solirubrobacterales bacterium]|nr:AarF/ABC1/UbiB kinase family protein [Solirubrobacterales bacterium]
MPSGHQIDAARRGLAVLLSMRGAAGKLAQLADFVDPGWAPSADRAELDTHLAELRRGTPEPLGVKRVERLLRDAWGGKLSDHLVELEPEPAATASAGQVHRGELDDGRSVAIKVLHPGLEDALRADLGNLGLLVPLAGAVLPSLDARAIVAELRDRLLEEMDLEHEAQSQRRFARTYRGHPFIHVSVPVTDLARTNVLVTEWVDGAAFGNVLELDASERDRYGEILARFHVGSAFHTGAFHADPHPGNHLLRPDGRVAFLDFGSVGFAAPAWLAGVLDVTDAAEARDGQQLARLLADLGYLAQRDSVDVRDLLGSRRVAQDFLLRHGRVPARDLLAGRMIAGLGAVLAQLRATPDWSVLGQELRVEGEPASELGEAEAAFWASRGHSRAYTVHGLRRARW